MTCNVGNTERTIRFVLGAILLAIAFLVPLNSYIQITLIAAGIVAVLTAAISFCPAWKLIGVNTCK